MYTHTHKIENKIKPKFKYIGKHKKKLSDLKVKSANELSQQQQQQKIRTSTTA